MAYRPVALIVLDGWGIAPPGPGNAVALARTPAFDALLARWPSGQLATSGADVGLPPGQFGNSEVGHLNLGAGFVVRQDLVRIDAAIEDGSLAGNQALQGAFEAARRPGAALHLVALLGTGGVHAHDRHLLALASLAIEQGVPDIWVHVLTDGRDTPPQSAARFLADLEAALATLPGDARIASIGGRYYGMDRDQRWERTAEAFAAIVDGEGPSAESAGEAIAAAYRAGTTDEFIPPTAIEGDDGAPLGDMADGDAVVLCNFRSDRMRQLLAALTEPDFDGFPRRMPEGLTVVTMTEYREGQRAAVAFPPIDVAQPLARVVAEASLTQLHAAETEKYAHVTWFLNGGREDPFPGEDRLLVPSPKVATYDLAPAMSAVELAEGVAERIERDRPDLVVVNVANPDMVGHTGDLQAAIAAVEAADAALGRIAGAVLAAGGAVVVTADHGNAEQMIDPQTGGPHTAHTTNPVPIVVAGAADVDAVADGRLADVAPTLLDLLGLTPPDAMTGRSLLARRQPAAAGGIIPRSPAAEGLPAARRADRNDA